MCSHVCTPSASRATFLAQPAVTAAGSSSWRSPASSRRALAWSSICANQEGVAVGLAGHVRADAVRDHGCPAVEASEELGLPVNSDSYDIGAQILRDLGLTTIRLLSNSPAKSTRLAGYDLAIVGQIPLAGARIC